MSDQALLNKLAFNGYNIWSTYEFGKNLTSRIRTIKDDGSTVEKAMRVWMSAGLDRGPNYFPSAADVGLALVEQFSALEVQIHDNLGNLIWKYPNL